MRARTITVEEPVTDIETAVATERARCAGLVRELARAQATHAAVANHLLRIAARTGTVEELMRQGAHWRDLVAKAEALTAAAAAIEEEPGT